MIAPIGDVGDERIGSSQSIDIRSQPPCAMPARRSTDMAKARVEKPFTIIVASKETLELIGKRSNQKRSIDVQCQLGWGERCCGKLL
jgi:hypothetical protein